MGFDWKRRFLDILLPRTCAACRLDLRLEENLPLCGPCSKELRPLVQCGRTPGGLETWSAFAYAPPIPALVHAFKYRGRVSIGDFLGGRMASLLPLLLSERIDAVTPVPLHPLRLRERGFNQSAVLAQHVADAARAPVANLLERLRNTAPQWRLNRAERALNLAGAFQVRADAEAGLSKEARILLIDDVFTTGDTLDGCARALFRHGFRRARAYVLAAD